MKLLGLVLGILTTCGTIRAGNGEVKPLINTSALFFDAVEIKDIARVRLLLGLVPDLIKARNKFDETPLHRAVCFQNKKMVAFLLQKAIAIKAKDNAFLDSPFLTATLLDNTEFMQLLLSNGANIETKENHSRTPLHNAVAFGGIKTVRFLLEHGANVHAKTNSGETPLHRAVFVSGPYVFEKIQLLVKHGANVWDRDNGGVTPLEESFNKSFSPGLLLVISFLSLHMDPFPEPQSLRTMIKPEMRFTSSFSHENTPESRMLAPYHALLTNLPAEQFPTASIEPHEIPLLHYLAEQLSYAPARRVVLQQKGTLAWLAMAAVARYLKTFEYFNPFKTRQSQILYSISP